jgi:hypothetical protein
MPLELLTPMLVDPAVAPLVTETELEVVGLPEPPKVMTALVAPSAFKTVVSAPAPRSVTLAGTVKPPLIKNVPDDNVTACPEAQLLRAFCMPLVASLAPLPYVDALTVAQAVVLAGMPPWIPDCVQSIARDELRIPDQACP